MANDMYAAGATQAEINQAVVDDLTYGVYGMTEAAVDECWSEAQFIAIGAMRNAFSYTDFDVDSEVQGDVSARMYDMYIDEVLEKPSIRAGDSYFNSLFDMMGGIGR